MPSARQARSIVPSRPLQPGDKPKLVSDNDHVSYNEHGRIVQVNPGPCPNFRQSAGKVVQKAGCCLARTLLDRSASGHRHRKASRVTRTFEQPQAVVSEQLVQTRIDRFGQRIKSLRQDRGLTVRDLAARCGVAASTISKVENARMSPTYDIILRLALGLGAQMEALFVDEATSMRSGRRSVTRAGAGARVKAQHYDYEMLSADVSNKRFHPIVATIGMGESLSLIHI